MRDMPKPSEHVPHPVAEVLAGLIRALQPCLQILRIRLGMLRVLVATVHELRDELEITSAPYVDVNLARQAVFSQDEASFEFRDPLLPW